MSIKLTLLDSNEKFLSGLINALNSKYPEEFEVHAFTNPVFAMNYVESADMDLFVVDSQFSVDASRVPAGCKVKYFSEDETAEGTIYKKQNLDGIYMSFKAALSAGSENKEIVVEKKDAQVIVFSSPCGGAGTSTLAAACSTRFASTGFKVLYLNLEKFGSAEVFFSSDEENFVKQDASGVYFCESSGISQLGQDEIMNNVLEAKSAGVYDYIIIDVDFSFDAVKLYDMAYMWIWCCDGSDVQNGKTTLAFDAFAAASANLCNKICLVYNKYGENSTAIIRDDIKCLGAVPFVEIQNSAEAVGDIATSDVFEEILSLMPVPEVEEPVVEEAVEEAVEEVVEEAIEEVVEEVAEEALEEVAEPEAEEPETVAEEVVEEVVEDVIEESTKAYLVRLSTNEKIVLDKEVIKLGRGEENDYNIEDNKYVGHSHCTIVTCEDGYYVVDNNSKNHTYIDKVMLVAEEPTPICDSQILRLANEDFRFCVE